MIRRPPRSTPFPTRRSSDLTKRLKSVIRFYTSPRGRMFCQFIADRKSTRLNSSHTVISYAVFCLKKKKNNVYQNTVVMYNHNSAERTTSHIDESEQCTIE